jgi:hypothetical protein
MPEDSADQPAPPFEPWTPVRCEEELFKLINAVAQAELAMRKVLIAESEARREYERAHIIAAMHPECPVPNRGAGGATVGMRDSWIRAMSQDEFDGLTHHKDNLEIQKGYQRRLEQQCSLVQSMARMVALAYQVTGTQR